MKRAVSGEGTGLYPGDNNPATFPIYVSELTFRDFGVKGTNDRTVEGMAAETAAYERALQWAAAVPGRRLLGNPGAHYTLNDVVEATGSIDIDFRGATTEWAANTTGMVLSCTEGTVSTLSTDYVPGSLVLDFSTNPLAAAPKKGTIGVIGSNGIDPANRDRGRADSQYRKGERFIVGEGSTTTQVVLDRALVASDAIDPVSTDVALTLTGNVTLIAGETVTQAGTGATGVVKEAVNNGALVLLTQVNETSADFDLVGELTGSTSGALGANSVPTVRDALYNEARVAPYTTALNTRVTFQSEDKVFLRNGTFKYEEGHAGGDWSEAKGIALRGFTGGEVSDITFDTAYDTMIRLAGCCGMAVRNYQPKNGENDTGNGHLGYGLSVAGAWNTFWGVTGHDCRHVYTSNSGNIEADVTDYYTFLLCPRTVGDQIIGGTATGCTNSPWDTHQDAESVQFLNQAVLNANTHAVSIRGRNNSVTGLTVINSEAGCQVFTEFASGQEYDDIYTAGRELEDMSSCVFSDLRMGVREDPYKCISAVGEWSGTNTITTQDHSCVYSRGHMTINGSHKFTVIPGTVTHDREGCLHVEAPHEYLAGTFGETSIIVAAGAVLEIDARNASAGTVQAFYVEDGARIDVHGLVRVLLPAGATLGDISRVQCYGSGRIEVSVEGADDRTLFTDTTALDGVVIKGIDDTAWWSAASDKYSQDVVRIFEAVCDSTAPLLTHNGDGTDHDMIYIPEGQEFVKNLSDAGEGKTRMVLRGRKTGPSDATLRLHGKNGDFLRSVTIPGATDKWELDLTMYVRTPVGAEAGSQYWAGMVTAEDAGLGTDVLELVRTTTTYGFGVNTHKAFMVGFNAAVGDTMTIETCEITATKGGRV